MNIQNVLLKVWRAIRGFVARHIDSGVARESKKASCTALRSNASKNAFIKSSKNASRKACGSCTSRALLSLFVASATLLATFVIAPAYALSAGENTGESATSTEKVEGAKSGSVKDDGESNKQSNQSESNNNIEPDKKNTGSSSTLTNNKESKPVEKPKTVGNNGVDKAKSEKFADETAVKKNVKDAKNKAADSAKAVNGTDRSVKDAGLSEECGDKPFKRCYVVSYYNGDSVVDNNHPVLIHRGNSITIKPKFEIKSTQKQADMPSGVWFKLEKYLKYPVPSWANFKKDNGETTKVQNTKGQTGFDGSITLRPNSKWYYGSYKFKVFAYYKSEKIYSTISVEVDVSDVPNDGDLKLSLYDFGDADSTAKKDNDNKSVSITIKPKSNTQGADKKDTYDPINKLFIDSKSIYKRGELYHHMICKDDANNYTVDGFNGLSLKDKKDNPSADKQTQFEHKEGENRPSTGAADSAVYESDPYTEESQSWISGTPTSAGTFECRVFAFKDAKLKRTLGGGKVTESSNLVKEFDARAETPEGKKSLFEGNIIEDKWKKDSPIQQGVDCDYKSVTIEVKSNKSPEPKPSEIGDNDLTLKVYPFKNDDGSLPTALSSSNNKISAILGMSLKPFVDATSAADSKNKITLRVLCSKGEKKKDNAAGGGASTDGAGLTTGSGSAVSGSNGANSGTSLNGGNTDAGSPSSAQSGSQPAQPSESSQPAEDPEYKTWSSNLAELGLSVPEDTEQNTCHSDKEGETTCKSADSKTNVAARTDKEVNIKPAKVGDYQCVVYALKTDALKTFDGLKGSLTPDSIKSELIKATPTAFKEHKDFAAFKLNIHSVNNFTLPQTGGQSWNLQLGILAALLVNLLAAGFVISQSERGRKLILGRWRVLCNYV